jgi:hypothetical protein
VTESLIIELLSIYCVPSTVLTTEDTASSKTKTPAPVAPCDTDSGSQELVEGSGVVRMVRF